MSNSIYCVWGNPISHSLSPVVHNLFAQQLGTKITYLRQGEGCDEVQYLEQLQQFFATNGKGCNVTSPFKQVTFNFISNRSPACEVAQACNTVVLQADGSLAAHNTDGYGLSTDLLDLGWLTAGSKVLMLGAGGAVTGVLYDLLQQQVSIDIYNRTTAKAEAVAERFATYGQIKAVTDYKFAEYDLVINAVAYKGADLTQVNFLDQQVTGKTKFYDMQYSKQGYTAFLGKLVELGGVESQLSDGLGMLVKQAALSYSLWFGVMPNAQQTLTQIREMLARQEL